MSQYTQLTMQYESQTKTLVNIQKSEKKNEIITRMFN